MLPDVTALNRVLAGVSGAKVLEEGPGVVCRVPFDRVLETMKALAGEGGEFDMLVDLFGTDTGEAIDLTWHLRAFGKDQEVYVRSFVPYDAEVASVWSVYPAALYSERETAELLGVRFPGHPNPKRLLTVDEIGSFPLRKSAAIRERADYARPGVRVTPKEGGDADE